VERLCVRSCGNGTKLFAGTSLWSLFSQLIMVRVGSKYEIDKSICQSLRSEQGAGWSDDTLLVPDRGWSVGVGLSSRIRDYERLRGESKLAENTICLFPTLLVVGSRGGASTGSCSVMRVADVRVLACWLLHASGGARGG